MKNIFVILFATILFMACANQSVDSIEPFVENKIVDKPGTYISKEKNLVLKINIQSSIINYTLQDTLNKILFKSGKPRASDVQRWFFVLVGDDVWFESSDIGTYILKKDGVSNHYNLTNFDFLKIENIKTMPKSVWENMPSSTKVRFKEYR
jgi:hypothetical protein